MLCQSAEPAKCYLIWQHEKLSARMLFRGKSPIRFDPVNHKSPLMSKRSVKCDCCPKSPPGCPKGSQWAEEKRDTSCSLNHSCTIWAQWNLALSESKYACACLIQYIHIVNWAQFFGLITPMNQDPTSWRSRSQHHPLHCTGLFGSFSSFSNLGRFLCLTQANILTLLKMINIFYRDHRICLLTQMLKKWELSAEFSCCEVNHCCSNCPVEGSYLFA